MTPEASPTTHEIGRERSAPGAICDYFVRREDPERLARRLVQQLERLGQRVTLEPVAAKGR